jgi:hypothetical protein
VSQVPVRSRSRILVRVEIGQPHVDSERRQTAAESAIAATWIEGDSGQGNTEPG